MSVFEILKTFLPLILLVGLLYGILYYVRKSGLRINGKSKSPFSINILNTQMILPKKYISVIKIKDKLIVLGISDQSISVLKEFDDDNNDLNLIEKSNAGNDANFLKILKKNLGF